MSFIYYYRGSFFRGSTVHLLYYYILSPFQQCVIICILNRMVESVHKLGEGTFSEVFGCISDTGTQLAVKVNYVAEFLASYQK